MVFTSLPLYNWNQDANQQPNVQIITSDSFHTPPSQPAGGGGGQGEIRPKSMVDRARIAQIPLPGAGLECPRCESTNTKFCYFNNYNLSQPRHFCKTFRRYWTRGGSLRNVPVGGGCRRNKKTKRRRSKCITAASSSDNTNAYDLNSQVLSQPQTQLPFFPNIHHLSAYVNGSFGFEVEASSAGSSRVQLEYPSIASGSDERPTGLYPFQESELDPDLDHDQRTEVKMEGNQGLGNQGNDDQFNLWSAGNAWNDLSGFQSSSTGNLL